MQNKDSDNIKKQIIKKGEIRNKRKLSDTRKILRSSNNNK